MNLFFSDKPGSHERHLRRKVNNPLFGDLVFTQQDVLDARALDEAEHKAFLDTFHAIGREAAGLNEHVEAEVLIELKPRLENSYEQSCYVMGNPQDIRDGLAKLIDSIMNALLGSSRQDEDATRKLLEEKSAREVHFELLAFPLIADLIRKDSPIQSDELIPTLLSEQDKVVIAATRLFTAEQLAFICETGERMLADVHSDNECIRHARESLQLLLTVRDQQQADAVSAS